MIGAELHIYLGVRFAQGGFKEWVDGCFEGWVDGWVRCGRGEGGL